MPNPLDAIPDETPQRKPFEDLEDIPVLNDSEESILDDAPAPKAPAPPPPPPAAPTPGTGMRRGGPGRVSSPGTGRRIVPPGAATRRAPSDSEIQRAMNASGIDERDQFAPEPPAEGPQRLDTDWDENGIYTFAHSGIRMEKGPIPILFVLAMLAVLAWGGLYGYFYWNGDRPIPTVDEVQSLFGQKK